MSKRLFGRYRLRERLGVGGWAEVWRATDEVTGDAVAVKRLHPHVTHDATARSRLRREAAAVSVIDSPAVVKVRDVVEQAGEAALILDYVDGEPLSEILARDGTVPRRRALEIVREVADALAAAHQARVVHRDIKPSNVILDRDGSAHLIDFGIAQAAEVSSQLTGTGSVVGTLRYLAPEVLRGEVATPASDVWALGALAYLLVDGRPPFSGVVPAELVAQVASPPPPPANAEPELADLLVRSLAPDPASRPRDAGEVAAALGAMAADSPTVVISLADPTVRMAAMPAPAGGATAPKGPPARETVAAALASGGLPAAARAGLVSATSRARAAARRPAILAGTVLAGVLGVAVVAAGLSGLPGPGADPGAAAAAGLASPTPTASPDGASPDRAGPGKGGHGGRDGGDGKGKGKGGDG
jgi:serine/threonine-protein kinase